MQTSPESGWIPESPLFMFNFQKTKTMENLSLQQIIELIWAKQDLQVELHSHPNRELAVLRYDELQSEINILRAKAQSLAKSYRMIDLFV